MTPMLRLLFSATLAVSVSAAAFPVIGAEDTQPETAPPEKQADQQAAPEKKAPPAAVHVASYKSKVMAERGWKVLSEHYSGMLYATPEIREVDLPKKGHYYRLFASGDPEMIKTLCASLKTHKLYCDPHPVTP